MQGVAQFYGVSAFYSLLGVSTLSTTLTRVLYGMKLLSTPFWEFPISLIMSDSTIT